MFAIIAGSLAIVVAVILVAKSSISHERYCAETFKADRDRALVREQSTLQREQEARMQVDEQQALIADQRAQILRLHRILGDGDQMTGEVAADRFADLEAKLQAAEDIIEAVTQTGMDHLGLDYQQAWLDKPEEDDDDSELDLSHCDSLPGLLL